MKVPHYSLGERGSKSHLGVEPSAERERGRELFFRQSENARLHGCQKGERGVLAYKECVRSSCQLWQEWLDNVKEALSARAVFPPLSLVCWIMDVMKEGEEEEEEGKKHLATHGENV